MGDLILLLRVFAHRYREGIIEPSGRCVRACTVEGVLLTVGQMLSIVGVHDP
jgi:hypothetical protein